MVTNNTDLKLAIGLLALVLMFGVGWAFGDPRYPVPQERPHPGVVVVEAVAGPMELMKPPAVVPPADTKEFDRILAEVHDAPVAVSKAQLALDEFDAWIKWVKENNHKLIDADFKNDLEEYADWARHEGAPEAKVRELVKKARLVRNSRKA